MISYAGWYKSASTGSIMGFMAQAPPYGRQAPAVRRKTMRMRLPKLGYTIIG